MPSLLTRDEARNLSMRTCSMCHAEHGSPSELNLVKLVDISPDGSVDKQVNTRVCDDCLAILSSAGEVEVLEPSKKPAAPPPPADNEKKKNRRFVW